MKQCITFNMIVDFYLLESASSIRPQFGRRPQEAAHERVVRAFNSLSHTLAHAFHDYLFLTAVGEARHVTSETNGWYYDNLPTGGSRGEAMYEGYRFDPKPTAKALIKLFDQPVWPNGYGGKAWADIARAVLLFYEVPHAIFVDHVIDLEHNNGTVFNKPEGLDEVGIEATHNLARGLPFKKFLTWKTNHDILNDAPPIVPSDWDGIGVTSKTHYAMNAWYQVFQNRPIPYWITLGSQRAWPEYKPNNFGKQLPGRRVDPALEQINNVLSETSTIEPQKVISAQNKIIYMEQKQNGNQDIPEEGVPSGKYTYIPS